MYRVFIFFSFNENSKFIKIYVFIAKRKLLCEYYYGKANAEFAI